MTYTQYIPHHAKPSRPPRPPQNANPGGHVAWLLDLENLPGYCPLDDEDVLAEGAVLPYKRLVDSATGWIRGRFATVAEERECRREGVLRGNETIAFLLEFTRPHHKGNFAPEEAGIAYRIRHDQISALIGLDGLDHERARRFTSRALAQRFNSGKAYVITTMDSEEVPWAAIAIRYKAAVGLNPKRLMHFRNSEPLDLLVSFGARFYAQDHCITCFIPFRHPVPVGEIRPLETLVEMSYGLERHLIDGIRRSYVGEDGDIGCVPGPHTGELFDPRTGESLPDTTWAQCALIDPALLGHVRYEGVEPVRQGPNEAQVEQIVAACGLYTQDRWGKRDLFHASPKGKFALVIPGKSYGDGKDSFVGEELTRRLYSKQLALGREFFTNVFEQETPCWLCVDFDVKRITKMRERVCVDRNWLDENIDWSTVKAWEEFDIYPEFRLSGRGFYIEFFFASRMDRTILKDLADRTIMLLKADRLELTKGQRVHAISPTGFRVVKDVTNLSYLVRMPGSVHHSAGFCSSYLDGSFVPPTRRSSPDGVERVLAHQTPSIYTMPPSLSSPSSDRKKATPSGASQADDQIDEDNECSSVEWISLSFVKDGHLYLNEEQRTLLVEELVADLFRQRNGRGPSPEPEPYIAACQMLIRQACKSPVFHLGTKQIQLQISEVQGHPEKSRNRASAARRALLDAGYIQMVEAHIRKGDPTAAGVPATRSHAARFQADIPKLVAIMKERWRTHREAKAGEDGSITDL